MSKSPAQILADGPMGRFQIVAVTLCVLLNALDGYDVLAISFAAPGIAEEWGINRAALGLVLSMELIGMAVGSVVLGALADRIGRRPTIILCLTIMATGMLSTVFAGDVTTLSVMRFLTGLGIGGMLAAINAMVAEYSNARSRSMAVALMASGYPVGVIIGGSIASALLAFWDWRSVFALGAAATALMLPVVLWLLPESIEYLLEKRPQHALARINRTLQRMGHETVEALPEVSRSTVSFLALFSPALLRTTCLLTASYAAHIVTFYFILKWIPKLVVDMGFDPSSAGSVLVWANVGGVTGSIILSAATRRFGLRALVIAAMLGGSIAVTIFGGDYSTLVQLSVVAAFAGMFTNSAIVGLYALFAERFPTELRATGTGFIIGVGRGGAVLGPVAAGFLFEAGLALQLVAVLMGCGSVIAAAALALLPRGDQAS